MSELTIKSICEQYRISQSELARRFGIPLRTVQHWHSGERKPPDYVVRMIRTILECEQKRQVEPMYTYEDVIKQLVTSGEADKILNSDKAKLLSTPAVTPEGDISPEWAEHLAQQKNLQDE